MSNKQSSVEWLIEQVINNNGVNKSTFQQAKAMHKQEMFEYIKQKYCIGHMSLEFHRLEFDKYYNETYGGNNEQQ